MADGSFTHRVADLELEPAPLDPATVLEGSPEVSELVLDTSADGRVVRGVWQITPGVVRDVEADEVFVVVSGRATVEVEGGPTLELEPGVVGCCERATGPSGVSTRRCARCSRSPGPRRSQG